MSRFNLLLLIALMASGAYLVHVAHENRRLFAELDKARNLQHLLDNDFERLKSEKQSQATPLRVEKLARDRLAMRTATPAVTQYVERPAATSMASAASAADSAR